MARLWAARASTQFGEQTRRLSSHSAVYCPPFLLSYTGRTLLAEWRHGVAKLPYSFVTKTESGRSGSGGSRRTVQPSAAPGGRKTLRRRM